MWGKTTGTHGGVCWMRLWANTLHQTLKPFQISVLALWFRTFWVPLSISSLVPCLACLCPSVFRFLTLQIVFFFLFLFYFLFVFFLLFFFWFLLFSFYCSPHFGSFIFTSWWAIGMAGAAVIENYYRSLLGLREKSLLGIRSENWV